MEEFVGTTPREQVLPGDGWGTVGSPGGSRHRGN